MKRITGAGRSVQITDNGRPLWIVQPAIASPNDPERAMAIDALLDEVLLEPVSTVSLSKLVKHGRR